MRELIVRARVLAAVREHAEARRAACDVTAVSVAVERIRIGHRQRACDIGVVVVTDQIDTAFDLRRVRPEQSRVGRQRVGGECRVERRSGARSAEVGVGVVDAGVEDGDLDAFAAHTVYTGPRQRRANARHADCVLVGIDPDPQNIDDARNLPQRFDLVLWNPDLEAVDGALKAADDAAARRFDLRALARLLAAAICLDGESLGSREFPARSLLYVGDGRTRQDRNDRDGRSIHAARDGLGCELRWQLHSLESVGLLCSCGCPGGTNNAGADKCTEQSSYVPGHARLTPLSKVLVFADRGCDDAVAGDVRVIAVRTAAFFFD